MSKASVMCDFLVDYEISQVKLEFYLFFMSDFDIVNLAVPTVPNILSVINMLCQFPM